MYYTGRQPIERVRRRLSRIVSDRSHCL